MGGREGVLVLVVARALSARSGRQRERAGSDEDDGNTAHRPVFVADRLAALLARSTHRLRSRCPIWPLHASRWYTTSCWTCAEPSASFSRCARSGRRRRCTPPSTTRRAPKGASPIATSAPASSRD